eukprot:6185993-Pleurochrysis_carterae.AAC.2
MQRSFWLGENATAQQALMICTYHFSYNSRDARDALYQSRAMRNPPRCHVCAACLCWQKHQQSSAYAQLPKSLAATNNPNARKAISPFQPHLHHRWPITLVLAMQSNFRTASMQPPGLFDKGHVAVEENLGRATEAMKQLAQSSLISTALLVSAP